MMSEILGRMAIWPTKRWALLGGVVTIAAGAGTAVIVHGFSGPGEAETAVAGVLGGAVGGWSVVVIALQLRQRQYAQETRALINIRPLTRRLPLDLGNWAVNPVLADELVRVICQCRPERIVECGSGWTTVLIAACLEELGGGKVVALEHKSKFARKSRNLLRICGILDRAEVRLAPLTTQVVGGDEWLWYDSDVVGSVEGPIDLLFVDGPPGGLATKIRYPAVPVLHGRLTEDCVVFLDDGFRDEERQIAREWGWQMGVEPVLKPRGAGFWILEKAAERNNDSGKRLEGQSPSL